MSGNRTVVRAVEMPMRWPRDRQACESLRRRIDLSLEAAARIANAVIGAMYAADIEAAQGVVVGSRIPPAKYPNTYQVAKRCAERCAPGMLSPVFNGVEQWARKRYASRNSDGLPYRIAALTGRGSVPTVRRAPYPVRATITWGSRSHRPHLGRGGEPFVWMPLLVEGGGCEWVELELQHRATRGHRRQYDAFRRMAGGDIEPGEISLYRKSSGRVMIKFVARFPVDERESSGVMYVRTRPDAFLVASTRGQSRDWWYNAAHVRRRIARKAAEDARTRQDMKAETRGRRGRGPVAKLRKDSAKHQRFMSDFLHNASAHLVSFARRRRVSTLVYDDTERGYMPSFPWAELRSRIEQKAEAAGIEFTTADAMAIRLRRERAAEELAALNMYLNALLKGSDDGDSDDREDDSVA